MRALAFLAAIFLALSAHATAAQQTRAVFVGIDSYAFSRTTTDGASFNDLRGAVADTIRFKNLMREVYRLELDRTPQGSCPDTLHPVSITLLNQCATRQAILDALNRMVDASAPKDTLLFYFAGHGSQYADTRYDQSSGYNGTILPYDARAPGSETEGDILDIELKAIKDRAVAKGVYFVSVFDSCNSGTGTRDGALGQSRNVPRLSGTAPVRPAPPPPEGPGGGYWVHLAAAQDGEQAQEVGAIGKREGVFTTALIETMRLMPFSTFGDIIREVQAKVAERGHVSQNPMAEGALKAKLFAAAGQGITYPVVMAGQQLTLKAGRLSGITKGSVFALHGSEADALAPGSSARAMATVSGLSEYEATLSLNAAPTAPLAASLVAIEKYHAFGDEMLVVGNRMEARGERLLVDKAVAASKLAIVGETPIVSVGPLPGSAGAAVLIASDGTAIGDLGKIDDPGFAERLAAKLKKVARVQQLLALRSPPDKSGIALCVDDSDYPATSEACPPKERGSVRLVAKDAHSLVTVENLGSSERYLYVLGIDPAFGVALILPQQGAFDSSIEPLKPHRVPDDPVVMTRPGTYRFVAIATERPINAAAFEQEGTRARAGRACAGALERLLCAANSGQRDVSAPRVGDWTAIVETVLVQ
ncbi:MAG: caspase family protein [Sphingorhabdus sp.]